MGYSGQSAMLKREIEAKLASRIPAALSPQALQAPRLMLSGVPEIDALLGGGIPVGGITEFSGLASSGRTSLAFSLLAEGTAEFACAYIDVDDTVDPKSAAAAGIVLGNLLWVRVAPVEAARTAAVTPVKLSIGFTTDPRRMAAGSYGGKNHPRTESRGLDVALGKMLIERNEARLQKSEGTPGFPNRKLGLAAAPEEQVAWEHHNARHADASDPIRQADHRAALEAHERAKVPVLSGLSLSKSQKPWNRLDKAIRAADQVLQSGGFRVVILDLASVPQEQAQRIPSATWFRFRRAAQESDAIFLLLTQVACARSSALCVVDCSAGSANTPGNLLNGLTQTAEIARQRLSNSFGKKAPVRAVSWETTPAWMRAAGR